MSRNDSADAQAFSARVIDASGFKVHDFGGNTIWLVRNDYARGLVCAITLADDSFPPDMLDDECNYVEFTADDFNAWAAGNAELPEDAPDMRATLAECLLYSLSIARVPRYAVRVWEGNEIVDVEYCGTRAEASVAFDRFHALGMEPEVVALIANREPSNG